MGVKQPEPAQLLGREQIVGISQAGAGTRRMSQTVPVTFTALRCAHVPPNPLQALVSLGS